MDEQSRVMMGVMITFAAAVAAQPSIDTFLLSERLRQGAMRLGEGGMPAAQALIEELASTVAQVGRLKGKSSE